MIDFKRYVNSKDEVILYVGNPDLKRLEELSLGFGDIWHSSFEQGYKNIFPEIAYQTATFFWYVTDLDNQDLCVSWRINPNMFAVRETAWNILGGFDKDYKNHVMQALDFGFNAVRASGAVCLYAKNLYSEEKKDNIKISTLDRYTFFIKNFKKDHSLFMIYRKGIYKINEWRAYFRAKKEFKIFKKKPIIQCKELKNIEGNPSVSYIIPTMLRQDFTLNLLNDLAAQTYPPTQVVVVDATPENQRVENIYTEKKFPFELIVKWQTTKGSCRARNEAITFCTSDYIIFGDDDIRVPSNYIENHIRFLQTYNADACNGLDIRADHQKQTLVDLEEKLKNYGERRYISGLAPHLNNANNCVKKKYVDLLVGNDVNYDGGYGEDNDFGFSLVKAGVTVLQNPYSTNLHLKPPMGGYRFWGSQAKMIGKKRKKQPWELDHPVKWIKPVPSPTVMYYFHKHFGNDLVNEYRHKYFFLYLFKGKKATFIFRVLNLPYRIIQFNKSVFYAKNLLKLGKRVQ